MSSFLLVGSYTEKREKFHSFRRFSDKQEMSEVL